LRKELWDWAEEKLQRWTVWRIVFRIILFSN
jgi:hypothetical protein